MSPSWKFALAYIYGYICLESEVIIGTLQPRSKRYVATIPVPDFVPFLGMPEYHTLESTVSIDNLEALVTAFFSSGTEVDSPSPIVDVCAKFVALKSTPFVLDVTMYQLYVSLICGLPFLAFPNVSLKFKY
jgi:hypothetical protein